jgi:hypothetical protein
MLLAFRLSRILNLYLKEYVLFFIVYILFYSIIFHNYLRFSYSKFIIHINYYLYFIIFPTTNFFSLILILTTIILFTLPITIWSI